MEVRLIQWPRVILASNENRPQLQKVVLDRICIINQRCESELPALRERVGDIPLLVNHFLSEVAEVCGREVVSFDRDAIDLLQAYHWPGNVRQLENIVERAVLLARGSSLTIEDLPPELRGAQEAGGWPQSENQQTAALSHSVALKGKTLREALEGPERQIILQALKEHHGTVLLADYLDINRTTLYKKMKRLGLDDPRLQFA